MKDVRHWCVILTESHETKLVRPVLTYKGLHYFGYVDVWLSLGTKTTGLFQKKTVTFG